jgi:SatD family (SatD)
MPRRRPTSTKSAGNHVAVIGDMIASRSLAPSKRSRAQERFNALMDKLNDLYRDHLRAKFIITLGDEFQGLLLTSEIIPSLIWTIERLFTARVLRLGFGYGEIYTSIKEYSINVDGPALHNARASIDTAKRKNLQGGVFTGFGPVLDPSLNGFARILHHQRTTWPARQREVVERLHEGRKGTEIATELGITKQAVSLYASLAGWEAYAEAEQGWRAILRTVATKKRR